MNNKQLYELFIKNQKIYNKYDANKDLTKIKKNNWKKSFIDYSINNSKNININKEKSIEVPKIIFEETKNKWKKVEKTNNNFFNTKDTFLNIFKYNKKTIDHNKIMNIQPSIKITKKKKVSLKPINPVCLKSKSLITPQNKTKKLNDIIDNIIQKEVINKGEKIQIKYNRKQLTQLFD